MSRSRFVTSLILFALLATACASEGVPRVTPTVAPTDPPTASPVVTEPTEIAFEVPSNTPFFTETASPQPTGTATQTATQTNTATATNTNTPDPSETPTLTNTPTATASNTATATQTSTATPTNTPDPSETPTLTRTPTATASNTATATQTSTATATNTPDPSETPTLTNTPTATASNTATATQTSTATATNTPEPSETPSLIPSATNTATSTNTATNTPIPTATDTQPPSPTPIPTIGPSDTPTPTNTPTPTPSITATPLPTSTPVPPTPDLTQIALRLTETAQAFRQTQTAEAPPPTVDLTEIALEFTQTLAALSQTLTAEAPTLTPGPTLDATPNPITAEAPAADVTPIEGEDTEPEFVPTSTPSPAPTIDPVQVEIRPTVAIADLIPPQIPSVNTDALGFVLGPGGAIPNIFSPVERTNLIARNPVDPSQYLVTNDAGVLFGVGPQGPFRLSASPFSAFQPATPEENQYFVEDIEWSPDGRFAAFVIDGGFHPDPTEEDGVHLYEFGAAGAIQLLVDAPARWHPGYDTGGDRQFLHDSETVAWRPLINGVPYDPLILVRARVTDDGLPATQGVLMILSPAQSPIQQPPSLRYDFGSWSVDGNRVVVSGRNGVGVVDLNGANYTEILSPAGFWYQDAVQFNANTYYALGRPGSSNGAMAIYDQTNRQVTPFIGDSRPVRVTWSPDRRSVIVVTANNRQFVANTGNGTVQEITGSVGTETVNWLESLPQGSQPIGSGGTGGIAPVGERGDGTVPIPFGVVEGSRFSPGQQLRVQREFLNLRSGPGTDQEVIGGVFFGEYVAILAGPVNNENIEWWEVQLASGRTGWMAVNIEGFDTVAP